jgi:hypothetical protein
MPGRRDPRRWAAASRTQRHPPSHPPAMSAELMVFDAGTQTCILADLPSSGFVQGSVLGEPIAQTWSWDGTSWARFSDLRFSSDEISRASPSIRRQGTRCSSPRRTRGHPPCTHGRGTDTHGHSDTPIHFAMAPADPPSPRSAGRHPLGEGPASWRSSEPRPGHRHGSGMAPPGQGKPRETRRPTPR